MIKTTLQHTLLGCLAVAVFFFSPSKSFAQYTITAQEVGGNVVLSGAGSITSLLTLQHVSTGSSTGFLNPTDGTLAVGSGSVRIFDGTVGNPIVGPANFGGGPNKAADSVTGDVVGIDTGGGGPNGFKIVALNTYQTAAISGMMSGSATYNGTTLAGLGMTPGTYVWSWDSGASSITLNVVPEPSSLGLISLLGTCVIGYRRRRS